MSQGAQDIRATAGAGLIGVFISVDMYGWTVFQIAHYYERSWRTDTWWLKAYVTYIWAVETVHTYLICANIWRSAISEFGNPQAWEVTTKPDDMTTGITGLVMLSVHIFYVRRLWILSDRNVFLCGIVTLLAFAHFALEIIVVLLTSEYPDFGQFQKTTPYYQCSLGIAAADDITIAASLCYFLYTHRTGIRSTDTLVNRIISYSIMTGAVTSVVDIITLVCVNMDSVFPVLPNLTHEHTPRQFVVMPDNLVYLAFFDFLPIFYVTSLLAMLNAREHLKKISTPSTTGNALSGFAIAVPRRNCGHDDPEGNPRPRGTRVSSQLVFAYPSTVTAVSGMTDTILEDAEGWDRNQPLDYDAL